MSTLTDLTIKIAKLCDDVENGGKLPDDLLAVFTDAKLEHAEKLTHYAYVFNGLRSDNSNYCQRSETLLRRAETCEDIEKKMKEQIKRNIIIYPDLPWKSTEGDKFRVQESTEALILSETAKSKNPEFEVPAEYLIAINEFKLDKEKIKEDLKKGIELGWAKLTRGTHLRIY